MARFVNDTTKVVVSVADRKAGRFAYGWTALADGEHEAPADGSAPRGNAGREKWAEYATDLGVEFAEDATREDIKAAVTAAQK